MILTEQHVATMAECLRRLYEATCGDEQYSCKDGAFRLNTTGSYGVARVYMYIYIYIYIYIYQLKTPIIALLIKYAPYRSKPTDFIYSCFT